MRVRKIVGVCPPISIRFRPDIKKKMDEAAQKEGRTLSNWIRMAVARQLYGKLGFEKIKVK